MPTSPAIGSENWLGIEAHPGTGADYLRLLDETVSNNQKTTVLAHNLHSLYLYYRSPTLRNCYQGTVNMVDGMPIIWMLQAAGRKVTREQRLTYVDFIWPMLEMAAEKQWRVCHIGQSSDVQEQALGNIRARLPELRIHGIDGYFDHSAQSAESLEVAAQVNTFQPQILLVGLGSPLQEHWIYHHRQHLDVPVVLSCGACMEYVAGNVGTPPRWMGKVGLEWSYRLFENPSRFAFRYLIEPWGLLYSMGRFLLRGRH